MGVIVKKKTGDTSGDYWVFVNYQGKRTSKKIGKLKAAREVANEIERELALGNLGILQQSEIPTLALFGQKYVDDLGREWAANTRTNYQRLFKNHIKPHRIGRMRLDLVEMHHVKDFINDLNRKKYKKGTIQFIRTVLHGIFEEARLYKHIKVNPCSRTGKYIAGSESRAKKGGNGERIIETKSKGVDPSKVYTPEEAAQLVEGSKVLGIHDHALFTLLLRTGIRPGEALGLSWKDINFEERTALIAKNWDYKHRILGPTKTKRSREVDLTPYTEEVLAQLQAETGGQGDEPVFTSNRNQRLNDQTVRNAYTKIRLKKNTLRDLRHTYATIRIAKGDNIVDVSKQLGHKNTSMTLDKYAQWLPRYHKGQVDELDFIHLSAPYTHPADLPKIQVADSKGKLQ